MPRPTSPDITDKIKKLMEWTLRSYMSLEDPNYSPELDKMPLLGPEQHLWYRMIIGSLNWLVTQGWYDIYHAASTMAQYGMAPQEGHLNATKRIMGYLWAYPKISIHYDARLPNFSKYKTTTYDWFWSYPEAQEAAPAQHAWTAWTTGKTLGLLWRQSRELSKDKTIGNRDPPIHQQLSNPLVLQKAELSRDIDIWIGTHRWKDSGGVHHRLQVQTTHAGSSSWRVLSFVWRQPVNDHEHYSAWFRT